MGKRKERRHAAMSNTGRRVKLDLFAEPSGDLGGSDVRDRVEREQSEPNELPNSPSSSGQRIENPLLLLGQYSDDEMDEDSDERTDDATTDSSFADKKELVNGAVKDGHSNANTKSCTDTVKQIFEQQKTEADAATPDFNAEVEGGDVTVSVSGLSAVSDGLHMQTDSSIHESGTVSFENHATRDVTSQWSMILHEESNRYYYWNTETGETSWEIPEVLAQTAGAYGTGYTESGAMVTDESNVVSSVEPSYSQPVQNILSGSGFSTSLTSELGERNISEDLRVKNLATDGDQVECQIDSAVNYKPCREKLAGSVNSDHVQANSDSELATDLPSRLLSQSESLLEKLKSLNKSDGNFNSHERISKYILEVEVRHSDVKALMLDTSHLLSFWLHTEKQLKRLEDSVNDEIYELAKSAVMDEIAETNRSSPIEKEVSDDSKENDSEDSRREGELDHSGKDRHSDKSADVGGDESPSHSQGDSAEQTNMTPSGEIFQKACSPAVEDIDMDVDMEVEESVQMSPVRVIDDSDGKMIGQTEPQNHHTDPSVGVIDMTPVPPPPGEEWIPPPPPPSESEDVPPPPPDAYSEPIPTPPLSSDYLGLSYNLPQSYMQQSADYTAPYSLPYPESNYPYISNPVAVAPNSQFYGHVDGSQVSLPQSTYYYETVPGTSEVAPATASTVEAYYDFKGAVPLFPVISSAESSVHYNGVGSATYNIAGLKSSNASVVVEPCSKTNDSSGMASLVNASSQSTDATCEVAGSSLLAKAQSKVKRTKKRTVTATSTLKSNKKVSSLVDKWKAAKEELNDSEEEEDDYVILDKKRQREIEEWKSRQIASGEAKDNANFQPLGGDWREKVKRRKERAGREAAASAAKEPQKKDEKQQQQQRPDLTKLSANLPSGWQAYWDDSTKKVYYGNTITSKTSWTQPTS